MYQLNFMPWYRPYHALVRAVPPDGRHQKSRGLNAKGCAIHFESHSLSYSILLNEVLTNLFLFLPKLGHIFQSLAFRFGYELPYEDGRHYADNAIKSISEHVAELISHFPEAHVVHR